MYYVIGITLVLTFLFVINLSSAFAAALIWRVVSRSSYHWQSRRRTTVLFSLRIFPIVTALFYSIGLALPAYVLFEPYVTEESIGYKQWLLVLACSLGVAAACFRAFASWWQTRRLTSAWLERAEQVNIDALDLPAFKIRHDFPVFAVVGVRKPRLFVAEQVFEILDKKEFSAVIEHELAHLAASDNLKRLTMHLCGDLLLFPIGRKLDKVWTESSEIAADEFAVEKGGGAMALSLASALIKIARTIPARRNCELPLAAFAVQRDGELLAARIRRLLKLADSEAVKTAAALAGRSRFAVSLLATVLIILPLALDTYLLSRIHEISEVIIRTLR